RRATRGVTGVVDPGLRAEAGDGLGLRDAGELVAEREKSRPRPLPGTRSGSLARPLSPGLRGSLRRRLLRGLLLGQLLLLSRLLARRRRQRPPLHHQAHHALGHLGLLLSQRAQRKVDLRNDQPEYQAAEERDRERFPEAPVVLPPARPWHDEVASGKGADLALDDPFLRVPLLLL